MIIRSAIIFLLLLPGLLFAGPLSLNTAHFPPRSTPDGKGFEDLIVKEAFRRAGYEVKIIHAPSERCLVNANNGTDDGNFARVAGLEATYPNLVMVPVPIAAFEFAVFSKRKNIVVDGWDSLKPYKTGIITGWKILEKNIGHLPSLSRASDQDSLFDMLEKEHIDLAVFDLTEGGELLRQRKPSAIRALKPLLDKRDMYIYLNKRHAALIGPLSKTLKDMKRDGTFQRILSASGR
jgi:polar amino acid transport system substrate-binding protein